MKKYITLEETKEFIKHFKGVILSSKDFMKLKSGDYFITNQDVDYYIK